MVTFLHIHHQYRLIWPHLCCEEYDVDLSRSQIRPEMEVYTFSVAVDVDIVVQVLNYAVRLTVRKKKYDISTR